ncbi:uncharacterized protein SPPG_03501 [Spizellomyces punctatus DAOM BR117]|uniref:Tyrosine specific protein phosphatases domain-containing protein n=1 Tax=Spizellomyces punctatus (strain DAOM BR117) TaxID=645134 RepID=A0A0L0HKS9_SPIPD|nr:uncharacterized protein SPPG_03501 [Spizellomyces punctatus DAOM BR117]KND01707.1 hypothetical protein SPPG_03501 [Spizellomyces punctatus DAOM BR117]|eukprot:XP_016609746.1 hypothetical protein SPPG_03501 [Spizellomyces punctatus DAOM BR117]
MSSLPPLYPPIRYGIVEEDLFRGAYPKERNFRFLRRLRLTAILSLTPEPPNADLSAFCVANNITSIHVRVDKPKEHVPLSFQKTSQILAILADPSNHPLFVHCLDGAGVTGAVIMCLRKLQCWTMASILVESTRYHKEGVIGSEEAEFVEKFNADIEVPPRLPKWLWGGHLTFKKHPTLRLKVAAQSGNVTAKAGTATAASLDGGVHSGPAPGNGENGMSCNALEAAVAIPSSCSGSNTQNMFNLNTADELGGSSSGDDDRLPRRSVDSGAHAVPFHTNLLSSNALTALTGMNGSPMVPVSVLSHALSVPKDIGAPYLSNVTDLRREKEELRRRAVTENLLGVDMVGRTGETAGLQTPEVDDDGLEDVEDSMSMTLQALALEMSGSFNKGPKAS